MLQVMLSSTKPIVTPKQYNYGIHQFIFENLSPSLLKKYYHSGFRHEKRIYKLFTFSVIDARFRKLEKHFKFDKTITIYFNSYEQDILENFASNLLLKEEVRFLENSVHVESAEFGNFAPVIDGQYIVKTLSPIVVRSTYIDDKGKRKSLFYNPNDDEFVSMVRNNLYRKLKSVSSPICDKYTIEQLGSDIFDMEIVELDRKPRIVIYNPDNVLKRFICEGYTGTFLLSGRKEFIEMAVKSGIGERNSSGFGMLSYQLI